MLLAIIGESKPTEVHDQYWIFVRHSTEEGDEHPPITGKWLVFKNYDKLDETWSKIRTAVIEQTLEGCSLAKVSTLRYNPSGGGPGPSTRGVICVYTAEHNEDTIGFKLIELVQQNISYKLDDTTMMGKYSHQGIKVAKKTLYWNDGKPSFRNTGSRCSGLSSIVDVWHVNVAQAPEPLRSEEICGKWFVDIKSQSLTDYWHRLKPQIESSSKNFGVIKMVCPSKQCSKSKLPQFHFYTSREKKDEVGRSLIAIFSRSMEYKGLTVTGEPFTEVLCCSDYVGEPDF